MPQEMKKTYYDTYKKTHHITPKDVLNIFDLGYLSLKKDFPGQLPSLPNRKKRNLHGYKEKKKIITIKVSLEKE